jgi:hypothetical protein
VPRITPCGPGNVVSNALQLVGIENHCPEARHLPQQRANVGGVPVSILDLAKLVSQQWFFEVHEIAQT